MSKKIKVGILLNSYLVPFGHINDSKIIKNNFLKK